MAQRAQIATSGQVRAFPTALRADAVWAVATVLRATAPGGFTVFLDGEKVQIPYRIDQPEPFAAWLNPLTAAEWLLVHCLYTRHCSGFVRQRHLVPVLAEPHIWTAPFALQLLGEYVVQIHVVLQEHMDVVTSAPFRQFCSQNPEFVALTKRRIVSYWDCYYRWGHVDDRPVFRSLREYPAFVVADALGWWGPGELPRLRAR